MEKKLKNIKNVKVNINLEDIAKKIVHWDRFNRYLILEALDVVKNSFKKNALELGCGSGVTTSIYAEAFEKLVVVDASESYLKQAKESVPNENVKFIHSYFETLNLDVTFEDVIMTHILEHVEDPVGVLNRARRWGEKSSRYHVIVPNGFSVHRRIGVELGILGKPNDLPQAEADTGHRRVYDYTMLEKHVNEAGFKVINAIGCDIKLFTNTFLKMLNPEYIDVIYKVSKQLDPSICADLYFVCEML